MASRRRRTSKFVRANRAAVRAKLRSFAETLAIIADRRLYFQILGAARTFDTDVRKQSLHAFDDAFVVR